MAAENPFPYTPTPGKLEEFLQKLQSVAVPPKIDQKYLVSVGFGSSNSRPFIPLMKKIGLLGQGGVPGDIYTKGLRGGDVGRALVADGIRAGYSNVYEVFDDAHDRSAAELATFFKSHSTLDDTKVGLAVSTFKALCKFGDFSGGGSSGGKVKKKAGGPEDGDSRGDSGGGHGGQSSVTINVNIALSVDATSDPKVYDAFFAAMAKHIKVLDGGSTNSA
ncbi:DUF5343 domain-containing protein [Occultella aeris]|uniref:DUF5343 domain-containing protein n=1 Tax=Occultella aeris TaxID=2761496 RepID=A0A7M4DQA1_9MICO|nr:DUF5343 domain-containing protein [Occultella aeris]VZO39645.1 hypothetical protein HALOF300_04339 [Occultella aeris]